MTRQKCLQLQVILTLFVFQKSPCHLESLPTSLQQGKEKLPTTNPAAQRHTNRVGVDVAEQTENDSVSIIAKCPEIPVGGRLKHFLPKWQEVTKDQWAIDVIKNGYKLEFIEIPPFMGIKHSKTNLKNPDLIGIEIQELIAKNAIEKVPSNLTKTGFHSTLFIVAKKSGEMRPVINLNPLNRYLKKKTLQDGYHEKSSKSSSKRRLGNQSRLKGCIFSCRNTQKTPKISPVLLQRSSVSIQRALCFGPTVAPRVFTKITSVVATHLRKLSIRLATYLDDWLSLNKMRHRLLENRITILNLLFELGFIVNKKKSSLVPSQSVIYIGGHFALDKGLVYPTSERVVGLKVAVSSLLQDQITVRDYLVFLGKVASCLDLIPNARLFMRPVQLHLLRNWSPMKMSFSHQIPVTPPLRLHLQWWLQEVNILKGFCFQQSQSNVTLTTDASSTWGWGGNMNNLAVQGRWTPMQQLQHINCLEMEAVFRSVKHFLSHLKNKNVLIRSDYSTEVQYINKQGGTKSLNLCQKTWDLWMLALENGMTLKAALYSRRHELTGRCS
ncbi:uncharacterized protein LOC123556081 [Mercenaria mercenaria]|uniref:uncharacterized protein LOC123556081 n=1 Tax=Mercenaria mercenaria TaxID=6596 RepID=UPI00234E9F80|nr:uncharacterized protein LOC123556081 [Mercenaria mercenaria]